MFEPSFCVKCNKEFYPTPMHVYRDHKGSYCSWTCYNHRNDKKASRYGVYEIEQYSLDGVLLKTFISTKEAADSCKGLRNGIRNACREKTKYKGYLWRYKNDMS
jgi:hypothetical protein